MVSGLRPVKILFKQITVKHFLQKYFATKIFSNVMKNEKMKNLKRNQNDFSKTKLIFNIFFK